MAENYGYTNSWDFYNKHLDPNIGAGDSNDFLNSARCIIYAQLSSDSSTTDTNKFKRIGVVQGFQFQEQRQIEQIFELGSDIPYLIPGRVQGGLSISRILLSGEDLANLIYATDEGSTGTMANQKFITSLRDPRMARPFDLLFAYYGQSSSSDQTKFTETYSRLFRKCLFSSKAEGINSGQIIVAEQVSIMYQDVTNVNFIKDTSFRL